MGPARERTRVPFTYSVVLEAVKLVDRTFGDKADRLAMRAAIAVAYGLSLRPGEYLKMSGNAERKPQEQAQASHACLWWDGHAYPITRPDQFPPGPAQYFTLRVDFLKQDQTGKGMPRSLAAPTKPVDFSCVQAIEEYARSANLRDDSPLLVRSGQQLTWTVFRWLMRLVALHLGFEPERLVVHSCRYGAVNQIMAAGHDQAAAMMQGGWATAGGAWAYMMPTISHSANVADAIHDSSLITVDWLKHAFRLGEGAS